MFDLRKCEIYPMLIGYHEERNCFGDKMTFSINGNQAAKYGLVGL